MSNQDDHALRLLEPLREEPSGPPRFDVYKAMAAGRRRRRVRGWSMAAAASAVTLVAAGGGTVAATALRGEEKPVPRPAPSAASKPPPTPLDCTMTVLPTEGVKKALVTAGDPTGRYLAGRVYPPGQEVRTVVWRDGKLLAGDPMPGSDATIDDLNADGVGVGTSYVAEDRTMGFVLRDGRFTGLPGQDPEASAINDAGVVVGSAGPEDKRYPVRWRPSAAAPERLPLPATAKVGKAVDIDEDGTVVGQVEARFMEGNGYLWLPDGTARPMPPPHVDRRTANMFWPNSIRAGRVAGHAVFVDGDHTLMVPAVYDIARNSYTSLAAIDIDELLIAADGSVLGTAPKGPAITLGKTTTRLPSGKGGEYHVRAFSEDGRTAAGYNVTVTGNKVGNQPIMWRCQ